MTTDDRGLAALAERLWNNSEVLSEEGPWADASESHHESMSAWAVAILGTDGVFLPDGPGTNDERCRAIEAAARAVVATVNWDGTYIPHAPRHFDALAALRAALEPKP
jgi:hypothetical protein